MCGRVWQAHDLTAFQIAGRLTMGRDPPHHHPPPHGELPLAEEDVVKMRARIADMGLLSDPTMLSLTSKEQELGEMVRLFPWIGSCVGVIHVYRTGH